MDRILGELKCCDREKPYIFISYSSLDLEPVWRDVLRFQKMGYNVWLDEKDADKTSPSWRTEALGAIRDINCQMLLFYVSSNSLSSKPCFEELSCTEDEDTWNNHFGPLKFVAVDLESISDIAQFCKDLHQKVCNDFSVAKSVRTERAQTVSRCLKQFFSKDKIRVRPIDSPARKQDYYEELRGIFPKDACIAPDAAKKEPDAPAVKETPVEPDPEPAETTEQKAAQGAETKPAAEQKAPEAPAAEIRNEEVRSEPDTEAQISWAAIADLAMQKANAELAAKKESIRFKPPMLLNFRQFVFGTNHIANKHIPGERIVGLADSTLLGSGKNGVLLTEQVLYAKEMGQDRIAIDLTQVTGVEPGKDDQHLIVTMQGRAGQEYYFYTIAPAVQVILRTYIDAGRHLMREQQCSDIQDVLTEFYEEELIGPQNTEA